MVIDLDTVIFSKLETGVYGLPTAVLCVLVKEEDDRASLCAYDRSSYANIEFGNLMVVNSLDVNGATVTTVSAPGD